MKRTTPSTGNIRRRTLAVLQVSEYIERYHPNMAGSKIEISSDGLIAGVSVKASDPPTNSVGSRRKRNG